MCTELRFRSVREERVMSIQDTAGGATITDIRRDAATERMRIKLALTDTIILDPDLRDLERRVALRLLSGYLHFRTLQMWPGAKRLAAELAVTERSVKRALACLCGNTADDDRCRVPKAYFRKVPGTGRGPGNTTRYEAIWERAFEGARVAKERLSAAEKGTGDDTKGDSRVPIKGDSAVTQSLREKPLKNPGLLRREYAEGEGANQRVHDADPASCKNDAEVAQQGCQADRSEKLSARSSSVSSAAKRTIQWRVAIARLPGPGELAAQGEAQKGDANDDRYQATKQVGCQAATPGGDATQDGDRTGRYGGRGRGIGQGGGQISMTFFFRTGANLMWRFFSMIGDFEGTRDLLGDPIPENFGMRGRPSHKPTDYNNNQISLLVGLNWSKHRTALALRITAKTLAKHYFREVGPTLEVERSGKVDGTPVQARGAGRIPTAATI